MALFKSIHQDQGHCIIGVETSTVRCREVQIRRRFDAITCHQRWSAGDVPKTGAAEEHSLVHQDDL